MTSTESQIRTLVDSFVNQLQTVVAQAIAARLQAALGSATTVSVSGARAPSAAPAPARSRRGVASTPKARRARELQGKYLGMLRTMKGPERLRVQAIAREKGVEAALAAAKRPEAASSAGAAKPAARAKGRRPARKAPVAAVEAARPA